MFKYVVLACVLAVSLGQQQQPNPQEVQILRFESDVQADGYNFSFDTSDGTSRQEEGKLENAGAENEALTVRGQYSFTAPDGKQYTVTFIAGPNGYQPKTSLGAKK